MSSLLDSYYEVSVNVCYVAVLVLLIFKFCIFLLSLLKLYNCLFYKLFNVWCDDKWHFLFVNNQRYFMTVFFSCLYFTETFHVTKPEIICDSKSNTKSCFFKAIMTIQRKEPSILCPRLIE